MNVRLVPLSDAVAPSRTSHRRLIGEVRAWALARGVTVDPDLLALHLAVVEPIECACYFPVGTPMSVVRAARER